MSSVVRAVPILLTALLCSCGGKRAPEFPRVSAEYAMARAAEQAAVVPRHSGTPGAAQAAEQICRAASAFSRFHARKIEFRDETPEGKITFRNLEFTIPGKSEKIIVIGAHYDAKKIPGTPEFHAANDGASGVAALLAMMKALDDSGTVPPFTLKFVFFDGEECLVNYSERDGFHGSRHYAAEMKRNGTLRNCRAMILLDMIGDSDLEIALSADTPPAMAALAKKAAAAVGRPGLVVSGRTTILDDHSQFAKLGIPAVDLIDFSFGPDNVYWHTSSDTLDKISGTSIKAAADLAMAMIFLM